MLSGKLRNTCLIPQSSGHFLPWQMTCISRTDDLKQREKAKGKVKTLDARLADVRRMMQVWASKAA